MSQGTIERPSDSVLPATPNRPTGWPITVVIPAHNPGPALDRLLHALQEQAGPLAVRVGGPLPVVVSDDGSTPPIHPYPHRHESPIALSLHRSPHNNGPGAARNRGLALVRTGWTVFLDADTVPAPRWLDTLLAIVAEPDPPDGIAGSLRIPGEQRPSPFTHATDLLAPEGAVGGNVAYRTDVLRAEGGFDERFYDPRRRIHFREDAALEFRMAARGRRVAWRPELEVLHPPQPRSYLAPIRLARRYYFDPLLDREHAAPFAAMNRARRIGPISLRRARHLAALGHAAGLALLAAGVTTRRRPLRRAAAAALAVSWPANMAALAWRRRVDPEEIVPLAGVAAVVPLVYAWHHTRGVVAFRHWPRY